MPDVSSPEFSVDAIRSAATDGRLEEFVARAGLDLDDQDWIGFVASAVALHRDGGIDLVASVLSGEGPLDHFVGMLYRELVPQLDVSVKRMFELADGLAQRSRDGSMPWYFAEAFADWAAARAERVEEAFGIIAAGSRALHVATLQAGLRADRARFLPVVLSLLRAGGDDAAAAGFVLSFVEPVDARERGLVGDAALEAIADGDETARTAAFDAALSIGIRDAAGESLGWRPSPGSSRTPVRRFAPRRRTGCSWRGRRRPNR